MSTKVKKSFLILLIAGLVILGFMALVKVVNVAETGPYHESIGLSKINIKLRDMIGTSKAFDVLSTVILVLALLVVLAEAGYGVYQLIKKRSLDKVDSEIYSLALVYLAMAFVYVVLSYVIVINTRPVVIEAKLESSFPSTHTMVALTVFFTGFTVANYLIQNKKAKYLVYGGLGLASLLMVIFRMLSGMHWFTDIVGGVLFACFFYLFHKTVILCINEAREKNNKED